MRLASLRTAREALFLPEKVLDVSVNGQRACVQGRQGIHCQEEEKDLWKPLGRIQGLE